MTGDEGAKAAPDIDILVQSDLWRGAQDVEAVIRAALAVAAKAVHRACPRAAQVSVALMDDSAIRSLNRDWRGLDAPTNVLSFPAAAGSARGGGPKPLGDIAIAYETTAREAAAEGKTLENHVSHLAVHGFLHLLGYDHRHEGEAEEMEALERAILATLGIADPYPR